VFPQDSRMKAKDVRIKDVTETFNVDQIDLFFDQIAYALKD
jgi:hypothetical protein